MSTVSILNLSVGDIPEGSGVAYDEFIPCTLKPKNTSLTISGRSGKYSTKTIVTISSHVVHIAIPDHDIKLSFNIGSIHKCNFNDKCFLRCDASSQAVSYRLRLNITNDKIDISDTHNANLFKLVCDLK